MKEQKNCYGLVNFSRITSGGGTPLVGSNILHQDYIDLTVSRASRERKYGRDRYYDEEQLIRLSISSTQFAELLTSMNSQGVPCTLTRVAGEEMDEYKDKSEREKLRDDFESQLQRSNQATVDLLGVIMDTAKKLSKKDQATMRSAVNQVAVNINRNTAYVREQFDESVDKTVKEAKGEIEAFILHRSLSKMVETNLEDKASNPMIEGKDK